MSNLKKQFIRNTFSGWLAQLSAAVVVFIMLPYNISHLGKEVYGISVLAVSAMSMLHFLNTGMGAALLRFFSQAIAKNDSQEFALISSTSQFIMGGIGLLGGIVIVAISPLFIDFYDIGQEHRFETYVLFVCLGLSFFLQFHSIVFTNIVRASNRFDLVNLRSIISWWLQLLALVAFYNFFKPSLIGLGMASLVAMAYNYVALLWFSVRVHGKAVLFSWKNISSSKLSELFSFSFLTMMNALFFSASIQIPVMILGKTLGKEMVTAFAPAVMLSSYLSSILGQITIQLTPIASRDKIESGGKNLGRWATLLGQAIACLGYGCIFASIVFISDILALWVGSDFVWTSATVTVLICGVVYASIQTVNYNIALGASTIAPIAYSAVVMAILTSLGTWIGTAYFHWGILEVAWCITIVRVLRNTFFLSWIYSIFLSYSFVDYFFKVYLKPLFFGGCLLGLVWLSRNVFFDIPTHLFVLLTEICVVAILYFLVLWFFVFDREIKTLVFSRGKKP